MPKHNIDYVTVYVYRLDLYECSKPDGYHISESLIPNASVQDIFPEEHAELQEMMNCDFNIAWFDFYLRDTQYFHEDDDVVTFATYKDLQRKEWQT